MRRLILGTAGHIDHGKTALVRALTGTDTDRLKEEKERGITIELGFAELELPQVRFGVVDVPGHEAFVRAMVAGAAGMDVVLLVVAADEGVMPQTREHLAIVELLGVEHLVVALTKCDLVDEEWIELVTADVVELLVGTPFAGSPCVQTSVESNEGLPQLLETLSDVAEHTALSGEDDLVRLPLDRVFTIQGTGTVITGTLWSGTLSKGERIRILPHDLEARVRGVQVHGTDVERAGAGDRSAVALTGEGADREVVGRGATLVGSSAWSPSQMLTARIRMLPDTAWTLEHNQRVRVHVGTAEVLARVALLEPEPIRAGSEGWVQLRLEEPLVARGRDRVVLRAYSPVTTIGGGTVAESMPPKRKQLAEAERGALQRAVVGEPAEALEAHLELAGWHGVDLRALPIVTDLPPGDVDGALAELTEQGALGTPTRAYSADAANEAADAIVGRVGAELQADALRPGVPLSVARSALPRWTAPELADAVIATLCDAGLLERVEGGVRVPGHRAELSPEQEQAVDALRAALAAGGLGPPWIEELPDALGNRSDLWSLLKHLESAGTVTAVADSYYVLTEVLDSAISALNASLGGRTGLGPADFREVLAVSRKHLIPLLNHLDGRGVTLRREGGRDVPATKRAPHGTKRV